MSVKPLKIGQKFFITGDGRSENKPKSINVMKPRNNDLDVEKLFKMLSEKLDSINIGGPNSNIYGEDVNKKTKAIDIDIKREIYIGDVDKNAIKSQEIKGKVNTKLDKLKALRKQNGS
jgi:hypothetical protein